MTKKNKTKAPSEVEYPISAVYKFDGQEKVLKIRPRLPFADFAAAAQTIASGCFQGNIYQPYCRNLLFWGTLIESFTDYGGGYEPDGLMRLIDESDITDVLTRHIQKQHYFNLCDAVDELIEHRKNRSAMDTFFLELTEALKRWDKKLFKSVKPQMIEDALSKLGSITGESIRKERPAPPEAGTAVIPFPKKGDK